MNTKFNHIQKDLDNRLPVQTPQILRVRELILAEVRTGKTLFQSMHAVLHPWTLKDFIEKNEDQRTTILNILQQKSPEMT